MRTRLGDDSDLVIGEPLEGSEEEGPDSLADNIALVGDDHGCRAFKSAKIIVGFGTCK